jgi:hypothetical protein
MKNTVLTIALMASTAIDTSAFTPAFVGQRFTLTTKMSFVPTKRSLAMAMDSQSPVYDIEATPIGTVPSQDEQVDAKTESKKTKRPSSKLQKESRPKNDESHQKGILSPVVLAAKKALGEEKLNKLRAQVISLHSDTIKGFVDTIGSTEAGKTALKALFNVADENHNGKIEEEELAHALQAVGFEWLREKQIHGIFDRADVDHNGAIDVEEWLQEAPRTLRTNLVKLAKKNGGELGLLV